MARKLLARGFIKECGRSEIPGRPILYETTSEFLDYFGLSSIEDLPNIEELKVQLSLFEAKVNKDTGFVTYACFAPGSHDDRVLSLLFAISQLKNEL